MRTVPYGGSGMGSSPEEDGTFIRAGRHVARSRPPAPSADVQRLGEGGLHEAAVVLLRPAQVHEGVVRLGAAGVPGLYFLGLPFQYALTSALIGGAGRDAAFVVDRIDREAAAPPPQRT